MDHDIWIEPQIDLCGECWIAAYCQCGWADEIHRPVILGCVQTAHDEWVRALNPNDPRYMKQTSGIQNLVLRF